MSKDHKNDLPKMNCRARFYWSYLFKVC